MVKVNLEMTCDCGGLIVQSGTFSNIHDAGDLGDRISYFYRCCRCEQNYVREIERQNIEYTPKPEEFKKVDKEEVFKRLHSYDP